MDDAKRLKKNAYMREWKRAHKGSVNKTSQKWKDANRALVRTREKERAHRRADTGPGYRALWLNSIRLRAKKKGLPFNITIGDLVFPEICPVLGIPIKARSGSFSDNSPSLDRTIPALGYVKGNVVIMSYRANRIKCHASLEDLEKIVAYMRSVGAP